MSNPRIDLEIRGSNQSANAALESTKRQLASLTDMASRAAAMIGVGGFAAATVAAISAGMRYNTALETQTVAFKTLLGSAEAANRQMEHLADFAASTPFELPEVVSASKLLQSLTQGALASGEGLRLVGDAAAASGRSFEETAMWVGRLYAGLKSGTPVGEATMRLLEMGLVSGETARDLNRLAESGNASGRAIEIVRETFSKTNGAMEEMSGTMAGMQSTLHDTLTALAADSVKPIWDSIKGTMQATLEVLGAMPSHIDDIAASSVRAQERLLAMAKATTEAARLKNLEAAKQSVSDRRKDLELAQARILDIEAELKTLAPPKYTGGRPGTQTLTGNIGKIRALDEEKNELTTRIEGLSKEINAAQAVASRLESAQAKLTAAAGTAAEEERLKLSRMQRSIELGSEDAFWLEQAKKEYAEQNRLIEQANEKRQHSIELEVEKARRQADSDRKGSYVGGTQDRWEQFQRSSAYDTDAGAGMIAGWHNAIMQLGTVAENAGRMIQNTIGGAISSVSQGISGLILGTMTWGQVLRQIGTSIIQTVIDGIVRMFTAWIMKRIAVKGVEVASATQEAAAKAPGALMDSISSWGLAALVGGAAFVAAMALAGGFQAGGYTGDGPPDEVAGLVHRGEFVVPASEVQRLGVDRLQSMTAMESTSGANVSESRVKHGGQTFRILNFLDRRELVNAMRDDIEAIVSDSILRHS